MTFPVPNGRVSQRYKNSSSRYRLGYHTGIDIAAPRGSDVLAACEGRVVYVGQRAPWGSAYGKAIIVLHRDMTRAIYAHLDKTLVSMNQVVKTGERIGKVGSTGNSTGPHLHFEVRKWDFKYGDDVDPAPYIVDGEPDITPKETKELLGLDKPKKTTAKKAVKRNAKPKPNN
jgi:murein DD-endopeptidase MepM/ murein hydrolase activator NlpD